jgi:hypothetical protein
MQDVIAALPNAIINAKLAEKNDIVKLIQNDRHIAHPNGFSLYGISFDDVNPFRLRIPIPLVVNHRANLCGMPENSAKSRPIARG